MKRLKNFINKTKAKIFEEGRKTTISGVVLGVEDLPTKVLLPNQYFVEVDPDENSWGKLSEKSKVSFGISRYKPSIGSQIEVNETVYNTLFGQKVIRKIMMDDKKVGNNYLGFI